MRTFFIVLLVPLIFSLVDDIRCSTPIAICPVGKI